MDTPSRTLLRPLCFSALLLAVASSIGCQSGSMSGSTMNMPVDRAWAEKRSSSETMGFAGAVFGNNTAGRVATYMADQQEKAADDAEKAMSSGAPIDAFNEMIDEAAQEFVRTLAENPLIKDSEYQLVMIVNDVDNQSGVENPQLESALKSIVKRLRRNETLRNDFVFLSSTDEQARKVLGDVSGDWGDMDPYGDGEDSTSQVRYHPNLVYMLQGEMTKLDDFSNWRMQLKLFLDVVHPRSRQIAEDFEFVREYRYHPDRGWISADLDDSLAEKYAARSDG